LLEGGVPLSKDALQAVGTTSEVKRQILDLTHGHLHGTGSPPDIGMPVACDPVRADRRRAGAEKQNALAGYTANFDALDL
jgi:hypothetical protein